jgi:hypothetical protein
VMDFFMVHTGWWIHRYTLTSKLTKLNRLSMYSFLCHTYIIITQWTIKCYLKKNQFCDQVFRFVLLSKTQVNVWSYISVKWVDAEFRSSHLSFTIYKLCELGPCFHSLKASASSFIKWEW